MSLEEDTKILLEGQPTETGSDTQWEILRDLMPLAIMISSVLNSIPLENSNTDHYEIVSDTPFTNPLGETTLKVQATLLNRVH